MVWVVVVVRALHHRLVLVFRHVEIYYDQHTVIRQDYLSDFSLRRLPWTELVSGSPFPLFEIFRRRLLKLRVLPCVSLRVNDGKDSKSPFPLED